jgi:hypothetical protein
VGGRYVDIKPVALGGGKNEMLVRSRGNCDDKTRKAFVERGFANSERSLMPRIDVSFVSRYGCLSCGAEGNVWIKEKNNRNRSWIMRKWCSYSGCFFSGTLDEFETAPPPPPSPPPPPPPPPPEYLSLSFAAVRRRPETFDSSRANMSAVRIEDRWCSYDAAKFSALSSGKSQE